MLRNLRIFVILPCWSETFVNKNVGKLIDRLCRRGARVHLYCSRSQWDAHFRKSYPEAVLLNCRPDSSQRGLIHLVRIFWNLAWSLLRYRPHVVLWTYNGYRENLLLWLLSRFTPLRYVVKCDSSVTRQFLGWHARLHSWMFETLPAGGAALMLAETAEGLRVAQSAFRGSKLMLFPNGAPLARLRVMKEKFEREASPLDEPYMLYTGRMMAEKGLDQLVEAYIQASPKLPKWRLVLVGEVWEQEFFERVKRRLEETKVSQRVRIEPCLSGEAYLRWYYFAEFYVLGSRKEGLPNVLIEALAFGLPVIAFNVGQIHSLIGTDAGILIEPGNIGAFAEAIVRLGSDSALRNQLSQRAFEFIQRGYDDDLIFSRLFDWCDHMLQQ